jgi:hypothetical protein
MIQLATKDGDEKIVFKCVLNLLVTVLVRSSTCQNRNLGNSKLKTTLDKKGEQLGMKENIVYQLVFLRVKLDLRLLQVNKCWCHNHYLKKICAVILDKKRKRKEI